MSFDFLFSLFEHADETLARLAQGAPLVVALALALVLGLRHASDPDHLVAVTSLVAADGAGPRDAAKLGAWWGFGHALALVAIGVPLILVDGSLPGWLVHLAEKAIGVVIVLLALQIFWKWARGGYGARTHRHAGEEHRHLDADDKHDHEGSRTPSRSFAIGLLHGLAGTGAVVLLLIAALPTQGAAVAALAVFAPMSVVSMAAFTAAFSVLLTRPAFEPVMARAGLPVLGAFGLLFGLSYAGLVV